MPNGGGGLLAVEAGAVVTLHLGSLSRRQSEYLCKAAQSQTCAHVHGPHLNGEHASELQGALGGAVSGRSTTDGRMLGKSTNMEPGSTEDRLWSRSLACSKAGSERGASAAHGAGRRPAQLYRGDGRRNALAPKDIAGDVGQGRALAVALGAFGCVCTSASTRRVKVPALSLTTTIYHTTTVRGASTCRE
jgi:hypothetical protein